MYLIYQKMINMITLTGCCRLSFQNQQLVLWKSFLNLQVTFLNKDFSINDLW